jgi:CMP-N-acetylneuraminic acid synthetase
VYHRNGAAYAITRECLIGKKFIKGDSTLAVLIEVILVSIDSQMDFDTCEAIMNK